MTHLLIKQAAGACLKHELAQQIKKQKLLALNYHSKGENKLIGYHCRTLNFKSVGNFPPFVSNLSLHWLFLPTR